MNIAKNALRPIPFDELPKWSPWPIRLLGTVEWIAPVRTEKKVDSEYDKDEYPRCLTHAKEQTYPLPEEVRAFEFRLAERKTFCISARSELFEMPTERILSNDDELLLETMRPFMKDVDTVVELGCGYGINLWTLRKAFPDKKYYGGEYSPNAVALANLLYRNEPSISVEPFNFYDAAYPLLDRFPKDARILVFTRHAIEQLPSARSVLAALSSHFPQIATVVHLEPTIGNYDDSLLGLLMRRYIAVNDYNRDLLSLLKARNDIEILSNDANVYGVSPLNPTSVIVWKPKR